MSKYIITHPVPGVTTNFGGLHFTDGVAEFDSNNSSHTDQHLDRETDQILAFFTEKGFSVEPVIEPVIEPVNGDAVNEFIEGIKADGEGEG